MRMDARLCLKLRLIISLKSIRRRSIDDELRIVAWLSFDYILLWK